MTLMLPAAEGTKVREFRLVSLSASSIPASTSWMPEPARALVAHACGVSLFPYQRNRHDSPAHGRTCPKTPSPSTCHRHRRRKSLFAWSTESHGARICNKSKREYSTQIYPSDSPPRGQSSLLSRSFDVLRPSSQDRQQQLNINSPRSESAYRHASPESPGRSPRNYRLEIVQQPLKTAEFGTSTLTRLPLAPPLIVQLHIGDHPGQIEAENDSELPFLVAQLSLRSADGSTLVDLANSEEQTEPQRLLYGNLVSSPHTLRNLQGRQGVYFLFPDVSVRWRGRFRMSVTLIRLSRRVEAWRPLQYFAYDIYASRFGRSETVNNSIEGTVLACVQSLPFDVLPRRDYVAPVQTPLTQYFLQQGARMYAFASSIVLH